MKVHIPSPLRSYSQNLSTVDVDGNDVDSVLNALDAAHPGIKFRMIDEQNRIRPHIKIYINSEQVEDLATKLQPSDALHIIAALSGG